MSRTYRVERAAYIAGAARRVGETVEHETIMRREPHRLGSLLRVGLIVPVEDEPAADTAPDFDGMTKKALRAWADEHDVTVPTDVTRVDDLRAYLRSSVEGN